MLKGEKNLKKEYWIVLLTYIFMHLSSFIGVPVIAYIGTWFGKTLNEMRLLAVPIWLVFSFTACLIIILWILRNENKIGSERDKASITTSIGWAFTGIFLAIFSQSFAGRIEQMMGIELNSENTQQILGIIEVFPIMIFVSSIMGPILEEIVFRKIIFGSLYKRFNFFLSALLSSVIFALGHMEPEHILLYSAMGFTFAFLYVKTNRIIVPIIAHVSMNTLVVIMQSVFKEDIERILRQAEKIQSFIGGF